MSLYNQDFTISFGDCDPAGIVYYPNFYRWMDATFHGFLRARGPGHAALCREWGAMGLGLMETGATFRAPGVDGDRLVLSIEGIDWSDRSYRVNYAGRVGERLLIEGFETRGLFVYREGRLRAESVARVRELLQGAGAA
ncbi:MAG: acyl-CoA thioesterase [Pararhodobacter sp.]|nr:acyl-CoA thioesterase [Pararhodobacter sp.]